MGCPILWNARADETIQCERRGPDVVGPDIIVLWFGYGFLPDLDQGLQDAFGEMVLNHTASWKGKVLLSGVDEGIYNAIGNLGRG